MNFLESIFKYLEPKILNILETKRLVSPRKLLTLESSTYGPKTHTFQKIPSSKFIKESKSFLRNRSSTIS